MRPGSSIMTEIVVPDQGEICWRRYWGYKEKIDVSFVAPTRCPSRDMAKNNITYLTKVYALLEAQGIRCYKQ